MYCSHCRDYVDPVVEVVPQPDHPAATLIYRCPTCNLILDREDVDDFGDD